MKVNPKYRSFYYQDVEEYPAFNIDLKKTAFLNVDMQKEFIAEDIGEALEFKADGTYERWIPFRNRVNETVIPNTKRLLDYFRSNDMRVTYGRIASLLTDGEDREAVQKTEGWNGINIHVDSENAQIVDEIAPLSGEIVVNKTTDSVVSGTNIVRLLRNMGIETVVVSGIVTDQCVASTVRGLADESFKVIVVEDACAAGTQELHDNELEIMNLIYCSVLTTDETLAVLEAAKEGKEI